MQRYDLQMPAAKNRVGKQKANNGERKGDFGKSTVTKRKVKGCKSYLVKMTVGIQGAEEYIFWFRL